MSQEATSASTGEAPTEERPSFTSGNQLDERPRGNLGIYTDSPVRTEAIMADLLAHPALAPAIPHAQSGVEGESLIQINTLPRTVVVILPPEFCGVECSVGTDIWDRTKARRSRHVFR